MLCHNPRRLHHETIHTFHAINFTNAFISLAYTYMHTTPHSVDRLSAALFCILYSNISAYRRSRDQIDANLLYVK
jgi:hypothetical protein